jgi:hypothetical protein
MHAISLKSLLWWQDTACHAQVGKVDYYYVVESLTDDECASIDDLTDKIAHYNRITLLLLPEKVLLQSTIAIAVDAQGICQQAMHSVKSGKQTMVEISQFSPSG